MKKILFFVFIVVSLFVSINSVNACLDLSGQNQYNISNSTTLCEGTYYMNTSSYSPALLINTSDIILDCNSSTIIGNGTGITIEFDRVQIINNVTVKNCNISGYQEAISDYGTAGAAGAGNNLTIYNNTISNVYRGISIDSPPSSHGDFNISSNTITSFTIGGIKINEDGIGGYIENNRIDGTEGAGIWMWEMNNTIIKNNNISNNDDGSAIECHSGSGNAGDCYNLMIYNNTLSENSGNGNLWDGNGIFLIGGTFDIDGNNMTGNFNYGSYLKNAEGNFTNNNILDSIGTGIGVYLYEVNNSRIYLNEINNSGVDGLRLEESFNNNISNITSTFNGYRGLYLVNTNEHNTIYQNTFTNNDVLPMDTYAASCSNYIYNNTASSGYDLYFENGSSSISDLEMKQLILCNISESSLNRINLTDSYGVRVFGGSDVNLTDFNVSVNVLQAGISLTSSSSKFTVSNSSFSSYANYYGIILGGSNHTIQSCNVENVNKSGIYVTSDDSIVRETLIQNTSSYGIEISTGERNTFYYNNITNTSDFGVYENSGVGNNFSSNRIYNIINGSDASVFGIFTTSSDSLIIESNYFYENCDTDDGVCGAMTISMSNATINSNYIFNDTNSSGSIPFGIYMTSYKNDIITMNNNEINASSNNNSYGVLIIGAGATQDDNLSFSSSGNVIRNADYGVALDGISMVFANSSIINSSEYYGIGGLGLNDNGTLTLTNITGLNLTKLNCSGTGSVEVNEYVRVQAQTPTGSNIAGVAVTLFDNESNTLWTDTTSSPTTYHESRIFLQNTTGSYNYTSLTATGIKSGYNAGTTTQFVLNTTTITITMDAISSGSTDTGGGGSGTRGPYNFTLTKENLVLGIFKYIIKNDGILFDEDYYLYGHRIHIEDVDFVSQRIKLRVFSEPFSFWAETGKDVKLDVDGDDYYDLIVNVEKVLSSSARIYFKEIEKEEVLEEGVPVSSEGEILDEDSSQEKEETPSWVWIVIIISILIGIGSGGKGTNNVEKQEKIK